MLSSFSGNRYTLVALVLAQLLRADPPPPELLGRWRSLETATTGLGSMFTFHSNGVVDFSAGAVVETTYRIEGGEMIFPPASINGAEQHQKMEFGGKDLLRLAEIELKRSGAPPDANNPILGEWVGKREMNGQQSEVRYIFYPTGKCLLLYPFLNSPGRYSIRGSTIRLELSGHQVVEGRFQIEGDVFTITSPSGPGYRFRRY